jgi:hypothetical protein
METVNFQKLIGETGNLYHRTESNAFQLGTVLFEVLEDEDDGYRSAMDQVVIRSTQENQMGLLGTVKIEESEIGYKLTDVEDQHVWLEFGTDHSDDYYPSFVFTFNPRPPVVDKETEERLRIEEIKNKLK